jgi:2'-phosphotransferase
MVEQTQQAKFERSKIEIMISKKMSYLLRHGAEKEGVKMDPAGYILFDDCVTFCRKGYKQANETMLMLIVNNNDKKRFEVKEENGLKWIRAA